MLLIFDGIGVSLGTDQVSCHQIEGVEHYYSPTSPTSSTAAFNLQLTISDVELTMHSPGASKLDHGKAPSESVKHRALKSTQ
jgi:hypothetical protein